MEHVRELLLHLNKKETVSSKDIEFSDVNYWVGSGETENHILRGVSGYVPAGKMLAIMVG